MQKNIIKISKWLSMILFIGVVLIGIRNILLDIPSLLPMFTFYGVILFIPLSYQLIILCNLLLRHQITILLFFIILFIQIIPLIISYFLSVRLYSSIIPQSSIIEK